MAQMTLTPAYGRDYKGKKACLADFDLNKDFILNSPSGYGTYINKEQIEKGTRIQFRYARLRSTFIHIVA
jgi:hypothetical protein